MRLGNCSLSPRRVGSRPSLPPGARESDSPVGMGFDHVHGKYDSCAAGLIGDLGEVMMAVADPPGFAYGEKLVSTAVFEFVDGLQGEPRFSSWIKVGGNCNPRL